MVLLYLSIPIMVLGIAIATLPLLLTMRREERTRREAFAVARPTSAVRADERQDLRAAA